jgi:hypothetical protein
MVSERGAGVIELHINFGEIDRSDYRGISGPFSCWATFLASQTKLGKRWRGLYGNLAAILVADVVGYSRLAGADEDRILARLPALRSDLIDPTIAVHNGRVVKRTGDGSLIEFHSVVDAVRCAIEVQKCMVERNAGLPPSASIWGMWSRRAMVISWETVSISPRASKAFASLAVSVCPSKRTGRSRQGSISRSTIAAPCSSRTSLIRSAFIRCK